MRPQNEVLVDPYVGAGDDWLQANKPAPELYKVDPATAAKLHGTVRFTGKKPPAKPISMDAEEACEKLHDKPVDGSGFVTGKDDGLADVFVYVKSGLEGKSFEPPKETVVLDQRGCMFVPRVIALHVPANRWP